MSGDARPDRRVVLAYLEEVEEELVAVHRLLEPPPNRLAPFHLQQAAEKLVKAVRLVRGLPATKEHRLEILLNELPDDQWRTELDRFVDLGAYATAYRYPTPAGARKPGPPPAELASRAQALRALLEEVRSDIESSALGRTDQS